MTCVRGSVSHTSRRDRRKSWRRGQSTIELGVQRGRASREPTRFAHASPPHGASSGAFTITTLVPPSQLPFRLGDKFTMCFAKVNLHSISISSPAISVWRVFARRRVTIMYVASSARFYFLTSNPIEYLTKQFCLNARNKNLRDPDNGKKILKTLNYFSDYYCLLRVAHRPIEKLNERIKK